MKYFVYYADDYENNGGFGLVICETEAEVYTFIETRISQKPTERGLSDYRVIRGTEMIIESVETVAKVRMK